MSKGLWPAVSGSMAQSERLDTIANNIANADTNGFKKDEVTFHTVLSSAVTAAQKEDIPRKLYKDKDFYRLDGSETAYVITEGTHTDFAQGRVKVTGAPLDVALEGKGFLEVLAPQGARFTRQGSLRLSADGTLVTTEGFPVLSKGGAGQGGENGAAPVQREELAARAIRLDPQKAQVSITADGKIFQGREQVGELSVVEFIDMKFLTKEASGTFRNDMAANISPDISGTTVRQGMIETSNVNSIQEMTELLKATRMFEANQKVVKAYGEMESRAVNDIGKL